MSFERNYENLAASVVGQACEDYCYALRNKKKYKNDKGLKTPGAKRYNQAVKTIQECEEFFKTTIYKYMLNPPEYDILIARLKHVANHPDKFQIVRFNKNISSEDDI